MFRIMPRTTDKPWAKVTDLTPEELEERKAAHESNKAISKGVQKVTAGAAVAAFIASFVVPSEYKEAALAAGVMSGVVHFMMRVAHGQEQECIKEVEDEQERRESKANAHREEIRRRTGR